MWDTAPRFNPDGYNRKEDGVRVTTYWQPNNLGVMSVPPQKKVEWEDRLEVLRTTI